MITLILFVGTPQKVRGQCHISKHQKTLDTSTLTTRLQVAIYACNNFNLLLFPPSLPPLQSNYFGSQSQVRETSTMSMSQQHHPSSTTIHHTTDVLSLTRQDSPDSGFGTCEPQNSPQNSPLVAQQHSPLAGIQQNSPIMAQQHSPLMQQNSSPLGCDPQQQLPLSK